METPIAIFIILIVAVLLYLVYVVTVSNVPIPVIRPITLPTSTTTANVVTTVNAIVPTLNTINIYEQDYQNNKVDFSITPAQITIMSGSRISFFISNQGQIDHSLNITGPVDFNGILLNTTNTINIGLGSIIPPGGNATLVFNAPEVGNYIIFSPIAGQEDLGMKANLYVVNAIQTKAS